MYIYVNLEKYKTTGYFNSVIDDKNTFCSILFHYVDTALLRSRDYFCCSYIHIYAVSTYFIMLIQHC